MTNALPLLLVGGAALLLLSGGKKNNGSSSAGEGIPAKARPGSRPTPPRASDEVVDYGSIEVARELGKVDWMVVRRPFPRGDRSIYLGVITIHRAGSRKPTIEEGITAETLPEAREAAIIVAEMGADKLRG